VTCARCGVDQAVHPQLGCVGGFVWQRARQRARLPVGTPLAAVRSSRSVRRWVREGRRDSRGGPPFSGSRTRGLPQVGGKNEADRRVERSLYQKAAGYSYDSVKIAMVAAWASSCATTGAARPSPPRGTGARPVPERRRGARGRRAGPRAWRQSVTRSSGCVRPGWVPPPRSPFWEVGPREGQARVLPRRKTQANNVVSSYP
jgi:hypothetical protein